MDDNVNQNGIVLAVKWDFEWDLFPPPPLPEPTKESLELAFGCPVRHFKVRWEDMPSLESLIDADNFKVALVPGNLSGGTGYTSGKVVRKLAEKYKVVVYTPSVLESTHQKMKNDGCAGVIVHYKDIPKMIEELRPYLAD